MRTGNADTEHTGSLRFASVGEGWWFFLMYFLMVICKFKLIMKLDCWDLKNEFRHSRASFIRICCWFSLNAVVHSLMAVTTQIGSVKFALWLHWQCKKNKKNKNSIRLKTKYLLPQLLFVFLGIQTAFCSAVSLKDKSMDGCARIQLTSGPKIKTFGVLPKMFFGSHF